MDLAIELPGAPLEAVMSNEVWTEVYGRLADLIEAHKTTLVFVNTRRLAERVTGHLGERLGNDKVMSHHGSLAAKLRLEAERRLKAGELKALVATASLELGIDIGSVDLVCQIGSARSISTFLQRVGRADHRRMGIQRDASSRSAAMSWSRASPFCAAFANGNSTASRFRRNRSICWLNRSSPVSHARNGMNNSSTS